MGVVLLGPRILFLIRELPGYADALSLVHWPLIDCPSLTCLQNARKQKTEKRRLSSTKGFLSLSWLLVTSRPNPPCSCSLASSPAVPRRPRASHKAWAMPRMLPSTRTWRLCWKPRPLPWRTPPPCWASVHAAEQAEVTPSSRVATPWCRSPPQGTDYCAQEVAAQGRPLPRVLRADVIILSFTHTFVTHLQ